MRRKHRVELRFPNGTRRVLAVDAVESVWDAADRAGIDLPHMCLQGWCTSCAGAVLEGDFDSSDALRYYPADRAAGFILLCTARPRSDMRIATHKRREMRDHRDRLGLPVPRA